MKKHTFYSLLCLLAFAFVFTSCKKDDGDTIPKPTADFTFTPDAANAMLIKFTNASTNYKSVSWNFGDNTAASTEVNPSHTYAAAGTYKVELTVLGKDGSTVKASKDVKIASVDPEPEPEPEPQPGQNLLKGGDMEAGDKAMWSFANFNENVGKFEFGTNGALKVTPMGEGDINTMIYQAVKVVKDKSYQFSANIKGSGMSNTWIEFYALNSNEGLKEEGGSDPQGNGLFLGWSTWCDESGAIDGNLSEKECKTDGGVLGHGSNGIYKAPISGTVYIGIKMGNGGGSWGEGIIVDDVKFVLQ